MPWITAGATLAGGLLGGKGSKSSGSPQMMMPQSNVSYSNLTPNAAAMPMYGWMAGMGQNLMQNPAPYFPGATYVGPSGPTQEGINRGMAGLGGYDQAQQAAQGAAGLMPGVSGQQGAAANTALGNYNFLSGAADVQNNPYVQGMMQQNQQSASDWLNNQALPQLQNKAVGVGNLGSSRLGLAQGQAIGDAQKNLLAQNAQTQMQAYSQGLGAQQNALGQLGNLQQGFLNPAATQQLGAQWQKEAADWGQQAADRALGYGQTVEGYQNLANQDQINRFNYMFTEPWARLGNIQGVTNALSPLGITQGGGGSMSMQQNPNYMSPYQGMVGGAQLGYGVGNAFTSGKAKSTPTVTIGGG